MSALTQMSSLIRREEYMLNQASNYLQSVISRLLDGYEGNEPSESVKQSLLALDQHLKGDLSWAIINQVELGLVDCYNPESLITEWQRRLAEVERLPSHLSTFYQNKMTEEGVVVTRSLLSRLISDLQWQSESERVIRFNESQLRKKVVMLFLFSFLLFFMPTISRVLFSIEFSNLRLYYIFTAASSGILGAAFSQLTSIQTRMQSATFDQVKAMSRGGYIIARAMVGAGAGLIMFYFVQSGLLSGAFFPEFIHNVEDVAVFKAQLGLMSEGLHVTSQGLSQQVESSLAVGTLARPAQGLSLLIVWCLLAGFSEKLIPGILNNKAKSATDASKA